MLFLFFLFLSAAKRRKKRITYFFVLSACLMEPSDVCVCVRLFSTNGHFWLTVCFKSILTRTMLLFFFLMFVCSLAANRSLSISLAHLLHWFHQQHLFLSLYIYIYIYMYIYVYIRSTLPHRFSVVVVVVVFFFLRLLDGPPLLSPCIFRVVVHVVVTNFFFLMCVCVSVCVCVCVRSSLR